MRFILILILLLIITPIFAQNDLQAAMDELLKYYNPEALKSKLLSRFKWISSKGKTLNRAIDKEIAQLILHADYKFYADIYPGEILIKNENIIGLNYIFICGAGGFCEYEKLVILNNNGEFITDFEFGKYLSDNSGRLVKENVYKSDSLMIFKTSDIDINPKDDSTNAIKIELQTINISDEGEINVTSEKKIDTRRKYYWISTDIVQDSTLVKYNKQKLAEMRNEIFASHGYKFKGKKWQELFGNTNWYETRIDSVNESISIIEKKNIAKIMRFENDEVWWKKYCQDSIHETNKQDSVRYEVQYPSNWFVKIDSFFTRTSSKTLLIENIKEKVIVAGGGPFTDHGSFFKIAVIITSQGKTIEEFIMNGDIPNRVKKQRLEQVIEMKIGGIETLVWIGSGKNSIYEFMFKGRRFRITCMSGSKEQYEKDLPIFQKMVELFKIIE